MATVKEQNILDAVSAVNNGAKRVVTAASYEVHPLTLFRHLNSAQSHKVSKIPA